VIISLADYVELRDALADALEGLRECLPYVGDYFVDKWGLDEYVVDAEDALSRATEVLTK
jgi:hypothetical protein